MSWKIAAELLLLTPLGVLWCAWIAHDLRAIVAMLHSERRP
jgi:hypothetical protein